MLKLHQGFWHCFDDRFVQVTSRSKSAGAGRGHRASGSWLSWGVITAPTSGKAGEPSPGSDTVRLRGDLRSDGSRPGGSRGTARALAPHSLLRAVVTPDHELGIVKGHLLSQLWRPEAPDQGGSRATLLPRVPGEGPSCPFQLPLARVALGLWLRHSVLSLRGHLASSVPTSLLCLIRTLVIGFRTHPSNPR